MFVWRVKHESGFIDCPTLENAMREYKRRTKASHTAPIHPVWKPTTTL